MVEGGQQFCSIFSGFMDPEAILVRVWHRNQQRCTARQKSDADNITLQKTREQLRTIVRVSVLKKTSFVSLFCFPVMEVMECAGKQTLYCVTVS